MFTQQKNYRDPWPRKKWSLITSSEAVRTCWGFSVNIVVCHIVSTAVQESRQGTVHSAKNLLRPWPRKKWQLISSSEIGSNVLRFLSKHRGVSYCIERKGRRNSFAECTTGVLALKPPKVHLPQSRIACINQSHATFLMFMTSIIT